jgi:tight adherence protein B
VLSLIPFVLAGILSVTSPTFIPMLTQDPAGRKMIVIAFILMVLGILWMRRIVRIDV